MGSKIISVVVTYYPEVSEIGLLLDQLLSQTQQVLVIDNTPINDAVELKRLIAGSIGPDHCELISFGENRGLAAALNIGCTHAMECGADYVLLSDQDSLPFDNMVFRLQDILKRHDGYGGRVAAVGPTYTDVYTELTYPFQVKRCNRLFYSHARPEDGAASTEVLTLITSGMLVSAEALREIGLMREDLFIDQIDIEWCLRARAGGYTLLGSSKAMMYQRMGSGAIDVWFMGWRREAEYPPLRLYYRFRNYFALILDRQIELHWKIRAGWYHVGLCYTHVVFAGRRKHNLVAILYGVLDGLLGRMGKTERRFYQG